MSLDQAHATDWPAIFRAIDRDITDWTPESLRAAFIKHGCCVVRGAIDLEAIARLRKITSDIYARTSDLHVYEPQIAEATQGSVSGYDLVSHPTLQRFLDRVFVGQPYRRETATARRISGMKLQKDWQDPLSLHMDSFFHEFWFTVNFWVPFDECGIEAPGLQMLPINYRNTRRYSGFSRQPVYPEKDGGLGNSRYFPEQYFSPAVIEDDFGSGSLMHPTMRPGDAIVSSNWIIHGSYRTPDMTKGRTSMELRFIGTTPDVAVRPDASDSLRIWAWLRGSQVLTKLGIQMRTGFPFWAERM